MYRHEVRFVVRFGVFAEFRDLLARLLEHERAAGWAQQRVFRAASGRINEYLIEHVYEDEAAYRTQTEAYASPGHDAFNQALSELADLNVPGTATQSHLYEI